MVTKTEKKAEVRYKSYSQDFDINIALEAKSLVKHNLVVQVIDEIVESLDTATLDSYYIGKGRPAYHPKSLLKAWLYAYCQKIHTTRPLAKKLREDICFMWLAGQQYPCHKTLSSFRSGRMRGMIDTVFVNVLHYLVINGYVDLSDLYLDGSKWEADGNHYKRVWRKNTERYKGQVLERIKQIIQDYDVTQAAEDASYGTKDLPEHVSDEQEVADILSSQDLQNHIATIKEQIETTTDVAKVKKLSKLERTLGKEQDKLSKYEQQAEILGNRNSYSKTDEDATMMRMKDDRLRPGYNPQISTSNQYIINATIHQNASDSVTLQKHWQQLESHLNQLGLKDKLNSLTADAGYGSEENYVFLATKHITAYVKYFLWYREVSGQLAKQPYHASNWVYDVEGDFFVCPNKQMLVLQKIDERLTTTGYKRKISIYESKSCKGCPFFKDCRGKNAKPHTNRTITRSPVLEKYKQEAKVLLGSKQGQQKRSQRSVDVETPFGNIKHNLQHRRFRLRGLSKVAIEFNCLSIAHNINKIAIAKKDKSRPSCVQQVQKAHKMSR